MGELPPRPDCSLIICSDWIPLPSCCLFYSYLHQFHHQLQYDGGGGVKWHPHLEGALTSPEIRGTLCVRPFPQWDLGLYRRQSRVSPYRPIPAPWGYRHFFTITLHSVLNASLSIWGAFLFVCSCFY